MSDAFVWNRDYSDHEQVRPFLPAFSVLYEALEARGDHYYDDAFLGLIPEIAGDDEGTALYLLKGLYRLEREHEQVAEIRETHDELVEINLERRFASVVVYRPGYYVGGGGRIDRYEAARVVPRDGRPYAILPRGARTRGHAIGSATVLVRP
jgi:hypothetical protein